jgi:hypothetical protein
MIMALYARLMGIEAPKIPVHGFFAALQEVALGAMTPAQIVAAYALSAPEQAEAIALRDRILQESSANAGIARWRKAVEFENVLVLGEKLIAPYDTDAAVKARLGVV